MAEWDQETSEYASYCW